MYQRYQNMLAVIFGIAILGSCGIAVLRSDAEEVADRFYESRITSGESLPGDLFSDDRVGMEAENQISRREKTYGSYVSHNRIGTNRHVAIEGRDRKESITFIFEVSCENGKTRETLMISREGSGEPYLITAYVIEGIPRIEHSVPDGTSTT